MKMVGEGETVLAQIPAPGQTVPGDAHVLLYLQEGPILREVEVPDFTGMDRREAEYAAGELGLYILITGNTEVSAAVTVTSQSFSPGTLVAAGTSITLEFKDTAAH